MALKKNKDMESLDNNIKRLLNSALNPVSATVFFKRGLLLHLKEELLRFTRGDVRQETGSDAFEENLSRLMLAAGEQEVQVQAKPGFKERLRDQVATAGVAQQPHRRINVLSPALAATVVGVMIFMVFLFGIEIYPTYWADEGTEVAATMNGGTGEVTYSKPFFFIWGTRYTTSKVADGETVSLSAGDKISAGSESVAVIDLFYQSSLKLFPGSELSINELKYVDEPGSSLAKVGLEKGTVSSEINDFNYQLATPSILATVQGTTFRTEVISAEHTYLATSEGTVEVTMNGDTVQVKAGDEVDAVKGETLVAKEASPPKLVITSPSSSDVYTPDIVLAGVTDVDAEVTVNGVPVAVNADGSFSVQLTLDPGLNTIMVTATNAAGQTLTVPQNLILL